MSDEKSFFSRWSERKSAARVGEPLPEPPAVPVPPSLEGIEQAPSEAQELPPLESLQGIESDYRPFMQPRVDADLKRAALKQLFNDPHFNQMDGLDVYIEDFGKPDPIPATMLAALNHARDLLKSEENAETESATKVSPPEIPPETEADKAITISSTQDSGPLSLDEAS